MIAALTTLGATSIAQSMDVSGEFAGEFAETTHQAISATRCAPRYVGCYPDKISERAVEYLAGVVHSPAQCASLCASYGYEAKGEWAGLFALQNNVPGRGSECYCAKSDGDHTKHVMEGSKCFDELNGVCYGWGHASGKKTICNTCEYPHDLHMCGGALANAVYHVDKCGEGKGYSPLVSRQKKSRAHADNSCLQGGKYRLAYRGCLRDDPNNRVMSAQKPTTVSSPWECAFTCGQMGMLAFGLEFGKECYCEHVSSLASVLASSTGGASPMPIAVEDGKKYKCDTHVCKRGTDYCGGDRMLVAYEVLKC